MSAWRPYICPAAPDLRAERIAALVAENADLREQLGQVRADVAALIRERAGLRATRGWRSGP